MDAVDAVVGFVADAGSAAGLEVGDAVDAVADAAASLGSAVSEFVAGLFGGGDASGESEVGDQLPSDLSEETDGLMGVVDDTRRLVGETVRG